MLNHAKLVAFAGVSDLDRSRDFYSGKLGLPEVEFDGHSSVLDANGTMLRLTPVREVRLAEYTLIGWDVTDIAATIRELGSRGVAINFYDGVEQDELGIWTAPNGAKVAWFDDPDGNNLSITQFSA